jgi:hypothetical protein
MKLPLIAACLVAGTTWSSASADQTSAVNPKTTAKSYTQAPSAPGSKVVYTSKTAPPIQKFSDQELGAMKAASIQAQKRALAAQNPPQPMVGSGGIRRAAGPSGSGGSLAVGGGDDCGSADVITGTGSYAFDTNAATTSPQQQGCGGGADNDVWFSWTAPSSGACTYTTCGGSGSDTVLAVWTGSGCGAVATACNDDACGLQSSIGFPVTAGTNYMLQLGGYSGIVGTGTFSLSISGPVTNDDCSGPVAIAGTGTFPFNTSGATTGPQQGLFCGGGNAYNDVWYAWTCPTSGTVTWSFCGGAGYDTLIAVYNGPGCPGAGTALVCNDDSCGLQSQLTFSGTAGAVYMLQVGAYSSAGSGAGTFTLNVSLPPSNDDCTSPTAIAGLGSFPYDNVAASTGTQGQNEALCLAYGMTTIDHDVWYTWTAPSSGCAIIDNCGDILDAKVAVYAGAGCPASGTALACNDDSCGLQSKISFTATAGATYLIQFGTFPGANGSIGSFNISQPGGGVGNDVCTSPTVIAGLGVFAFDNSPGLATTGCEGQAEALCAAQYGQLAMENDIWMQWTAPSSGFAVWDDCGLTSVDTKVAAYQGTGCPAQGSALACMDDSCPGFQTTLVWPVTAGTTYTIQIGTFPGAIGGPGSFSLNIVLPPTNDDCTSPVVLGPVGPYPFALLGASTGAQGQNEAICNFYGLTAIENDIWFTWTAPSTARANLTFCLGSSFDSKAAVYTGAGCPVGSAIACNDDACGLTTEMCFDVTGGTTYTIQVGTFPGAGNNFVGSFDIFLGPANPLCTYDDGTTENLLVWTVGGDMVWLNAFGTPSGNSVVSSVDVMWGSAMFPGYNPASNGDFATDIFIWQDGPTQDNDPSDATLLLTIPTTVTVWDTDTYVSFPIAPLAISGVFFVGSHQDSYGLSGAGPVQFVAPMDQNCPTPGVAWFFGNNSGFGTSPVDYTNPSNNVQPPVLFQNIGLPCQVMVRAGCNAGPATYLCDPGSGPTIACPCANPPAGSARGCDNSSATGGASVSGAGSNSLANPTVVFTTAGEKPTATSILLQGTAVNPNGLVFGQGVRCVVGVLKRLYVKTAVGGSITAPNFGAGDLAIPARSAALGDPISAGQSRWYMVYYRDPIVLGGCSALSTFNATNSAAVLWQP